MALVPLLVLSYLAMASTTTVNLTTTNFTTANTLVLGSYSVPTTANTLVLGSYPVPTVVMTDDYAGLSKHTLVPQEESLETSSTLTVATELEMRPFIIAATPHLTETGAFHTEISIVSRETSAQIDTFLTEMAAVSTDIGENPIDIGAVSTKTDAFTAETSVIPTETSVIPTETSGIPTETSVIPTETSVIPTETSVIPTETSVIPTETSVTTETNVPLTEISVIPTEKSVLSTEKGVSMSVFSTKKTAAPTELNLFPTETTDVLTDFSLFTNKTSFNSIAPPEMSPVSTVNATVATSQLSIITTPSLSTLPPLEEEPEPPYFFCSDYSPQSCSGKCGEVSQVGCSCDERCLVYNSCCYDYEDVCKMEANTARIKYQKLLNLEFTCQKVLYQDTSGSQVISSCPSNNSTDQLTKQQCEIDEAESFLRPVTSKTQKFHFKNIYCMLCNDGELSDALFWTNAVGFDNRRLLIYVYDGGQRFHEAIQTHRLFVPPILKDVPLRNCFVDTTSSCPQNSAQHLTELCSESTEDLVSLKQGRYHRLFKNIHCLNCSLQDEMFEKSCKHTEVSDVVYTKAPTFQFLLEWKSQSSFIVTHKLPLNWDEMECLVDEYGLLQQVCQITKCRGSIILKNSTCSRKNVINCFLYTFDLHVNVSEQVNDMESVNRTIEIFKPKLSDTINDAYSKIISIHSLQFGVSSISLNSELGQLSTSIWIKLNGVSTASFTEFGLNAEHFKFLNRSMADVRLDFYLCACQATKFIFGACKISDDVMMSCHVSLKFCVGSRSDGTDNVNSSCHTESSMFLIFCMFLFNYLRVY